MKLPPEVMPILEKVRAGIPRANVPYDFWQIDHGPSILDGFMEMASQLMASDLREETLPRGYVLASYLFDWEAQCQSDGWGAFGNVSDQHFARILSFYREVGLGEEAASLLAQRAAYRANPSDAAALQTAVNSTQHEYSGDLDRLEFLTQYLCDNAEPLFYEAEI